MRVCYFVNSHLTWTESLRNVKVAQAVMGGKIVCEEKPWFF